MQTATTGSFIVRKDELLVAFLELELVRRYAVK
jgi:hypothetical protein